MTGLSLWHRTAQRRAAGAARAIDHRGNDRRRRDERRGSSRRFPGTCLALLVLIASLLATGGPAAGDAAAATYFGTLPPGASLPGDADCAALIRRSPWEPKPENYGANHTPANHTPRALWSAYDPRAATAFRDRVNGNFLGTTDELIQFYSCKWGFDENIVRAVAHRESTWSAAMLGDSEWNAANCAPGYGVPCPTSFGLMQVRWYYYAETFPHTLRSTAFNLDIYLALQRACFEGWVPWLHESSRWHNGQRYGAGDQWGCIGWWFSGGTWHAAANRDYVARVQSGLSGKPWLTWPDRSSTIPYDTRLSGTAPAPPAAPTPTPAPSAPPPPSTPATPGGGALLVYDDAPGAGFWDGSYGYAARTPCDAAARASGACSYAIALNPWGALNLGKEGGFATRGQTHLEFALQLRGQPLTSLAVLLKAHPGGTTLGQVRLAQAHVTATLADGWVRVAVPVAQLNPGNGTAYTVQIQNQSSGRLGTIRVDALRFVATGAALFPPVSAGPQGAEWAGVD